MDWNDRQKKPIPNNIDTLWSVTSNTTSDLLSSTSDQKHSARNARQSKRSALLLLFSLHLFRYSCWDEQLPHRSSAEFIITAATRQLPGMSDTPSIRGSLNKYLMNLNFQQMIREMDTPYGGIFHNPCKFVSHNTPSCWSASQGQNNSACACVLLSGLHWKSSCSLIFICPLQTSPTCGAEAVIINRPIWINSANYFHAHKVSKHVTRWYDKCSLHVIEKIKAPGSIRRRPWMPRSFSPHCKQHSYDNGIMLVL